MFGPPSGTSFDADSLLADLCARIEQTSGASPGGVPHLAFTDFVSRVNPRYRWYRHCRELAAVLQRVADGEITKLMVFLPPRHSKSETISRLFSAYYLWCYPQRFVGLCSYSAELAYTLSRAAKDFYLAAGGMLRYDAKAVKHWEAPNGGGFWAAGVGGPMTGKGFHLGIIDDPLKNAADAASDVLRAKQQEWYQSTFSTRAEPGAATIVVQTRWHEQDLAGYLLGQEADGEQPEGWTIVHLPAVAEDEIPAYPASCSILPDWRTCGEALCPERYDTDRLAKLRGRVSEFFWAALFQQRPRPREGGVLKAQWLPVVAAAPAQARRVRYWDKAGSTKKQAAYTVGVLMAVAPDGLYYIEDVVRGQLGATEREALIKQTAATDAARYGNVVQIWVEQEPGSGGLESAQATIRNLAGYPIRAEVPSGDKLLRGDPFVAQAGAGNVRLMKGAWNAAYVAEMIAVPNGTYWDQWDATSGAFNKLAGPRTYGWA
jgi:predicted phage terminase large subunit-like protein